ncbi:hypothetical protein HC891_17710 [Candidatus Gracilibacteria bacterium]|nr:hypothetical protein [Candidatus Gracilibacteria bacterium]
MPVICGLICGAICCVPLSASSSGSIKAPEARSAAGTLLQSSPPRVSIVRQSSVSPPLSGRAPGTRSSVTTAPLIGWPVLASVIWPLGSKSSKEPMTTKRVWPLQLKRSVIWNCVWPAGKSPGTVSETR